MIWTLAARNVMRNRRRSIITVLSIAVGLAALTFLWGFIDGMNRQMVNNTTRYFAADAQVHLKGYHDDPSPDRAIEAGALLLETVRADPAVAAATARLETTVLASRADRSRGIMAFGVDPADEARVTDLFKAVVDGRAFTGAADTGMLIGEGMAEALAVRAGDELVLVGQAYDGSVASARVPVRGVFRTKIDDLDGYVAVMPMAAMREFLAAPDAVTAVALRLRDQGALGSAVESLSARVGGGHEVVGWPELLPMVAVSIRFHEVMGFVVLTIFFVMVAAAVANPVLMAVLERTREFGIMLALGTGQSVLFRLVVAEAALLGLAGLLLGNAVGLGATAAFGRTGIDLGAFEAGLRAMPGLADVIYPVVRAERSLFISVLVFVIALAMALYPAFRAATLEPVAAIRGIEDKAAGERSRRPGTTHPALPVFVLIATRNLLRNRKRSAITVFGAAFAIVAYVFLYGFFDGFGEQIVDNSTRYITGHIQLEREGLRRDLAPELAFDATAVLAALRDQPDIAAAAPRVQAQALASSATKSVSVVLYGVDPALERGITILHRTIVQGTALDAGAERDIVIGRRLAEKLGIRLGEKLVVMAPGLAGELGTAAFRVRGIFATESSSFDGAMVFVTLPAAQRMLGLGQQVSSVNLRLADRAEVDATAARLAPLLANNGLVASPWPRLLPRVVDMLGLIGAIRMIIVAVFFLVVALAVMNTVFMAVAERTREFGVMMALGTQPEAIVRMVVYETVALMLVASAVGYAIGAAVVFLFGSIGLDLSRFYRDYSAIPGLTGIVYPRLVIGNLVGPGIGLFLASVAVSFYPAARAARLDPTVAIRHT
ncbi:ABC transporter permease [Azohydromonas lata]|uniref:ABC transporter permease n=1 Tax=Azohydromonas lata TaxID=45677 RepID=UPI0008330603|nr:ABC transporter permease [Azohydromonas lata]